jgi:hypothetical protein
MMLADVTGLGRCYWQMLADDADLADAAGRMVRRTSSMSHVRMVTIVSLLDQVRVCAALRS